MSPTYEWYTAKIERQLFNLGNLPTITFKNIPRWWPVTNELFFLWHGLVALTIRHHCQRDKSVSTKSCKNFDEISHKQNTQQVLARKYIWRPWVIYSSFCSNEHLFNFWHLFKNLAKLQSWQNVRKIILLRENNKVVFFCVFPAWGKHLFPLIQKKWKTSSVIFRRHTWNIEPDLYCF